MEKKYLLDSAGVDEISSQMEDWLQEAGVNREIIIRLRLTMEELLIRIKDRFDGAKEGILITGRRFGEPYFLLRYKGEAFDPVHTETEDNWSALLLDQLGLAPVWTYRDWTNEIRVRGPARTVRSETRLGFAAILGILLGIAGNILPAGIAGTVSEYVFQPVSDIFINTLSVFVGMLVFLCVVTGICSIGNISDFSRMGKNAISCMLRNTIAATGICMLLLLPFFRFGHGVAAQGSSQAKELVGLLVSLLPSNPVTPFEQGNILQIVFIASLTGCGLLILGEQADVLKQFLQQTKLLVNEIVQGICRFLPVYIFASLTAMLWKNGIGLFVRLWKPLVVYLLAAAALLTGKMAWTCLRLRLRPKTVMTRIKEPILIGLTTSSSAAAVRTIMEINERSLGISHKLNNFATPLACLFIGSAHGAILAVILYYLAEYYSVPVDVGWLITAWILCSIFSMTVPPVSGGMLLMLGILMKQLNIPNEGLAAAGLLSLFLDFVGTGTRIGILHFELLLRADHLKMWNRRALD